MEESEIHHDRAPLAGVVQDEITFVAPGGTKAVAISLWERPPKGDKE